MNLTGKTILITGAAGRIGSATARLAAARGADIVLSDILPQRLHLLERNLKKTYSSNIHSIIADTTTDTGIDYLLSESLRNVKEITSAVHSAYPTSPGWGTSFETLKLEHLNQDLSMQLGGAIMFSRKILGYFSSRGGGDLVHISSIQGIRAPKFDHYENTEMSSPIEYAAIKAGIISITRWLAKYYANQHIRVNCVSPGGIIDKQPSSFLERYRKSCTNVGMLTPEQASSAIIFLLSSQSSAINGHNLVVDDGCTL